MAARFSTRKVFWVSAGIALGFASALLIGSPGQGAARTNVTAAYPGTDIFADAFLKTEADYVDDVKPDKLLTAAIEGMVSSLDPHSSYMDPQEFENFKAQTNGEFAGLGMQITPVDGLIQVVSPIKDTPAMRAGIKAGDFITAIDGATVEGLSIDDAVAKMRGPVGTQVTLTLKRSGYTTPFGITLTRAIIAVESVEFRTEGDIGYIHILDFSENTESGVEKALATLKRTIGSNLKGYVLDLRNNPGGLLDQAVAVSDDFLDGGEIVSTRGRDPDDVLRYHAHAGDLADGLPIVVLIDEGSASAAEIVAGALQDHRRATIIGMTSFGKGSVQSIIPIGGRHGGALRLTTSKYYTPLGRSIQAVGITPDIVVANGTGLDASGDRLFHNESTLPGHFAAEGHRDTSTPPILPAPGRTYDDFQLAYALDRLDGRVVSERAAAENAPPP